ncbi:hypothetical protein HK101_010629 [Irineochytrium annulatum]|nr:hypothetical protein HK101_010629 [Irineochytrium annulatum]
MLRKIRKDRAKSRKAAKGFASDESDDYDDEEIEGYIIRPVQDGRAAERVEAEYRTRNFVKEQASSLIDELSSMKEHIAQGAIRDTAQRSGSSASGGGRGMTTPPHGFRNNQGNNRVPTVASTRPPQVATSVGMMGGHGPTAAKLVNHATDGVPMAITIRPPPASQDQNRSAANAGAGNIRAANRGPVNMFLAATMAAVRSTADAVPPLTNTPDLSQASTALPAPQRAATSRPMPIPATGAMLRNNRAPDSDSDSDDNDIKIYAPKSRAPPDLAVTDSDSNSDIIRIQPPARRTGLAPAVATAAAPVPIARGRTEAPAGQRMAPAVVPTGSPAMPCVNEGPATQLAMNTVSQRHMGATPTPATVSVAPPAAEATRFVAQATPADPATAPVTLASAPAARVTPVAATAPRLDTLKDLEQAIRRGVASRYDADRERALDQSVGPVVEVVDDDDEPHADEDTGGDDTEDEDRVRSQEEEKEEGGDDGFFIRPPEGRGGDGGRAIADGVGRDGGSRLEDDVRGVGGGNKVDKRNAATTTEAVGAGISASQDTVGDTGACTNVDRQTSTPATVESTVDPVRSDNDTVNHVVCVGPFSDCKHRVLLARNRKVNSLQTIRDLVESVQPGLMAWLESRIFSKGGTAVPTFVRLRDGWMTPPLGWGDVCQDVLEGLAEGTKWKLSLHVVEIEPLGVISSEKKGIED